MITAGNCLPHRRQREATEHVELVEAQCARLVDLARRNATDREFLRKLAAKIKTFVDKVEEA